MGSPLTSNLKSSLLFVMRDGPASERLLSQRLVTPLQLQHQRAIHRPTKLYRPTRSPRLYSSVQPQSSHSLPETLLSRRSAYSRDLPPLSALTASYRWLRTLPLFIAIITVSAFGIFNYQKVNSPIIAANLYSLRTNPFVRELLGDEVYFASKWAWIWGEINLVQGRVDVHFNVKGTREKGSCRFKAKRIGGRNGEWKTEEWSLKTREGRVIQLLGGPHGSDGKAGIDPMEGATF